MMFKLGADRWLATSPLKVQLNIFPIDELKYNTAIPNPILNHIVNEQHKNIHENQCPLTGIER